MATAMVSDEDGVSESDGDKSAVSKHSYANRLKSNINYNQRLQRSVMSITQNHATLMRGEFAPKHRI